MYIYTNILQENPSLFYPLMFAYVGQGSTCHPDACHYGHPTLGPQWIPLYHCMVGMTLFPSMATLSLP